MCACGERHMNHDKKEKSTTVPPKIGFCTLPCCCKRNLADDMVSYFNYRI